ncbi:hypothetical protein [Streptomyces sp. RKAG290]|uniref:hypothetical protein n=1 Tax=Streptomyces sp. RKAG290 TaxID=2888348 RepID=UPI0020339A31|nr:hypothetical protein [Streptomyces sp. RKAG290]MCM2412861.1 hypothetical protein [Streptomyces sp. RKAG290]
MTVFQCRSCHRAVTPTVTERPLPDPEGDAGWHRAEASPPDASGHSAEPVVRMPPGTFAVDPDPSGPPYVLDEPSGFLVESGPVGTIVLNPVDGLGLEGHPDIAMRRGYCCGMDGEWGPNLVCTCGAVVATVYSDCYQVQELRLRPDAVARED